MWLHYVIVHDTLYAPVAPPPCTCPFGNHGNSSTNTIRFIIGIVSDQVWWVGNDQHVAPVYISQVGTEDLIDIAQEVKDFVDKFQAEVPEGISLDIWIDTSQELQDRMSVLTTNAGGGLILVLVVLALFLKFRVAMWVAIGIPVALLGTIGLLPFLDFNISTLTVMGFILVL